VRIDSQFSQGGAGGSNGDTPLPAGIRLGDFEVTEVIGQGGFGIVYLAFDHSLQRRVAIKEFMPAILAYRAANCTIAIRSPAHEQTFRAGMRSFINEARILAKFDHPALLKVLSCWEQHGTAYMAMSLYEGRTLRQYLREFPKPSENWLKAMLWPLLDALDVLHRSECYHRDVSPENIMILQNDSPVLLDFGAARRIIGDLTQDVTVILKPGYAPLEQYADDPSLKQGPWTDIYAVAAVLRQAITGKPPSISVTRVFSDTMKPLRGTVSEYSDTFLAGIDGGLAVRPEQRPQTVAEFRHSLGMTTMFSDAFAAPAFRGAAALVMETTERGSNSTLSSSFAIAPAGDLQRATVAGSEPADRGQDSSSASGQISDSADMQPHPASSNSGLRDASLSIDAASVGDEPARNGQVTGLLRSLPRTWGLPWKILAVSFLIVIGAQVLLFWSAGDSNQEVQTRRTDSDNPANGPGSPVVAETPSPPPAAAARPGVRPALNAPVDSTSGAGSSGDAKSDPREKQLLTTSSEATRIIDPDTRASGAAASASPPAAPPVAGGMSPQMSGTDRSPASEISASTPTRTGKLRFNITPWGDVFVDGNHYKASPPLKELTLPEGRHRIEIRNGQFTPHFAEVEVRAGANISIFHSFN